MQRQFFKTAIAAFISSFFWLLIGFSNPAQAIEKTWNICAREVTKVENRERIPLHLLSAISLVETGRWNKGRQAILAWPWTVTAEGKGKFFKTKKEAIKNIKNLVETGVTNIDVGCMQINLFYHGDQFDNLEQALDPRANISYAAKHLKDMHVQALNWTTAAGYYHSKTPKNFQRYKEKVVKFWNTIKRDSPPQIPRATTYAARNSFSRRRLSRRGSLTHFRNKAQSGQFLQRVSLSPSRTRTFNDRFRVNREKRLAAKTKDVRSSQLKNWREFKGRGINSAVFSKARRAALKAQRKREYAAMEKTGSFEYFEKRRKHHLSKLRLSNTKKVE